MKNISAGIANVVQGEPGLSAYQVAVKNGFSGTEQEWLDSLHPNDSMVSAAMDVATAQAQVSAQQAALASQQAQNAAASASNALQSQLNAERSATEAANKANEAHGYAGSAATAAGTASADAVYISSQISAMLSAVSLAGASERNAAVSQQEAYNSEIRAARSAELAAERTTGVNVIYAETMASIAAGVSRVENAIAAAEAAADRAAATVGDINADASVMSGYAITAKQSANQAASAAERAEMAAQSAQNAAVIAETPMTNYYNKAEINSQRGELVASITAVTNDIANIVGDSISAFNSSLNSFSVSLGDSITAINNDFGGSIRAMDSVFGDSITSMAVNFGDSISSLRSDVSTIIDEKVIPATAASVGLVKLYDEAGEAIDGTMTQRAIKQGIDSVQNALFIHTQQVESKLTGVYTFKGSIAYYANLPQTGNKPGDVYNVRNGNKAAGISPGDNVAWVEEVSHIESGYEHAEGTFVLGTTYYTDSTGTTAVDTSEFENGVTDVTPYFVPYTRTVIDQAAGWDKLAGNFVLEAATDSVLGGVIAGDNLTIDNIGRLSVPNADESIAGAVKILQAGGTDSLSTMSQAAITNSLAALQAQINNAWTTNGIWVE